MTQDADSLDYSTTIEPFNAQWEWTDESGSVHVEPFIFPDPEGRLEEHIRKYVAPDLERDFIDDPITWVNEELRKADIFDVKKNERITPSWFCCARPPKPRLNVLYFPTCASLYAHIVAIFNTDRISIGQKVTLKLNKTIVSNASFFLGIEDKKEIDLYVVAIRPLDGARVSGWDDYADASVCVLVDWRFYGRKIIHSAVEFKNIPGYLKSSLKEEEWDANKVTIVNHDVLRAANGEDVPYDKNCSKYYSLVAQKFGANSEKVREYKYASYDAILDSHFLHSSQYDGEACCCATAGACTMVRLFWNLFTTSLFSEKDFKAAATNSKYFSILTEDDETKYINLFSTFYSKYNADYTDEDFNVPEFYEEACNGHFKEHLEDYKKGWMKFLRKTTEISGYGTEDHEEGDKQVEESSVVTDDALYGKSLVSLNSSDPYSSSAFPYSNNIPAVIVLDIMLATYGQRLYAGDGSVVSYLIKKESAEEEKYQKALANGDSYFSPRAPVIVCAKVSNAYIQTLLSNQISKNQEDLANLDAAMKKLSEKDYSDDYINLTGPHESCLRTGKINVKLIYEPYLLFCSLSKNSAPDIYEKIPNVPTLTYANDTLVYDSSKEIVVNFVNEILELYNEFIEHLNASDATLVAGSVEDIKDELLLVTDYTGEVTNSKERAIDNAPGDYYAPRYWTREKALEVKEEDTGGDDSSSIDSSTTIDEGDKANYQNFKNNYYAKTFNEGIVDKESDYISLNFPDDYNDLRSSIVVFTDYEVNGESIVYRESVSEVNKKINIVSECTFRGIAQRIASAVETLQKLPEEHFLYLGCDLGEGTVYKTDSPSIMRQTRALSFPSSVHWPTGAFSRIINANTDDSVVRVVAKREDTCAVTVENKSTDSLGGIITTYKVSPKMAYALVNEIVHPEETVYFTWGAYNLDSPSIIIDSMILDRSVTYNDPKEADYSYEGPALLSKKDFSLASTNEEYTKKLIRWNGVNVTNIVYDKDGIERADGVVDYYKYSSKKVKNIIFDSHFTVSNKVKNSNSREGEIIPFGKIKDHHNIINVLDYPKYILDGAPDYPPTDASNFFEKYISKDGKDFFIGLAKELLTDGVIKGVDESLLDEESVTVSLSADICKYTAGDGITIKDKVDVPEDLGNDSGDEAETNSVEDSEEDSTNEESDGLYDVDPQNWDKNKLPEKEISLNLIPGKHVVLTYPNGEEKRGEGTDWESLDPDGYLESLTDGTEEKEENGETTEESNREETLPEEFRTEYPEDGDGGVLVSVFIPKEKKQKEIDYDHEAEIQSNNEEDVENLLYVNGEFIHGSDPANWPGGEEYWDAVLIPGMTVELNGPVTDGTETIESDTAENETSEEEPTDEESTEEESSDSRHYYRHTYKFHGSDDIEIEQLDGTNTEYVIEEQDWREIKCDSSDVKFSWKGLCVKGLGTERSYVRKLLAGTGLTCTVNDVTRRAPTSTAILEWSGIQTVVSSENHDDVESDFVGNAYILMEGSNVYFEKRMYALSGETDDDGNPIEKIALTIHSKPASIKGDSHIRVESSKNIASSQFNNVFTVLWTGFNAYDQSSNSGEATGLKAGEDIYFKITQVGIDDDTENVLEISGPPQPILVGGRGITVEDTSEQNEGRSPSERPEASVYNISWIGLNCDGAYVTGITAGDGVTIQSAAGGNAVISVDAVVLQHPTIIGDEYIIAEFNDTENAWELSLDADKLIDDVVKEVQDDFKNDPWIRVQPVDHGGDSGDDDPGGGDSGGDGGDDGDGTDGSGSGSGSGDSGSGSGGGSGGTSDRGPGLNIDNDGNLSWIPERSNAITDPYLSQKAAVGLCNETDTPLQTTNDESEGTETEEESTTSNAVVTSLGKAETKEVLLIPESGFDKATIPTSYVADPIKVLSGLDKSETTDVIKNVTTAKSSVVSGINATTATLVQKTVITGFSVATSASTGSVQIVTNVECNSNGTLTITYGYLTPKTTTVYVLESAGTVVQSVTPTNIDVVSDATIEKGSAISAVGTLTEKEVEIIIKPSEGIGNSVDVMKHIEVTDETKVSVITGLPNVKSAELDLVQIPIGSTLSDAAACPGNVPCPEVKINPHINEDDVISDE